MARLRIAWALICGGLALPVRAAAWGNGGDELVWPGAIRAVEAKLGSPDVQLRRAAARELGRLPENVQRRLLPSSFSDPDPEVRLMVADAALRIRLPEAGARVVKWLNDSDARVRASAAEVLGVLPHPGSAAALGRVLEDPDPSVRAAAAVALGNSDSRDATVFLLGHLDDSDAEVRHAVIAALEDQGDPRAVVPLIGRIQEQRAQLRRQAVAALGTLGDARAASALIVALNDGDAAVRAAAASALGKLRFQDAVWPLSALLESEADPEVQGAVLNALGAIGSPKSVEAILGASGRRHWSDGRIERALTKAGAGAIPALEGCLFQPLYVEAAPSCVRALGALGGERAEQLISRALREGVVAATDGLPALGQAGEASALPAVLEYLASPSPTERRAAIDAAGALLRPERGIGLAVEPILLALSKAQGHRLEQAALIGLLGRTGSSRAAPGLLPLASSSDEYLRAVALEALGQLAPAGADPVLLQGLNSAVFATRWTAALALRRAGTRASVDPLLDQLDTAPQGQDQTLAVALAGPLSDAATDAQLDRVFNLFDVASDPVKDALVEALAGVPGAAGLERLQAMRERLNRASRAKLAEALAGHAKARRSLLELASDPDPAVRANAVWSLGSTASAEDISVLVRLGRDPDLAVAANAVGALARTAQRLGLDVSEALCGMLNDGRTYVLVNALVGVRRVDAACAPSELPGWLLLHHPSDEVRIAAARLARHAPAWAKLTPRILERCARKDVSGRVAAECSTSGEASPAAAAEPSHTTVSVLVIPAGSTVPAPRSAFALVRPDGWIRCGTSDRRGSVAEWTPPGALRLALPAVYAE